MRRSFCTTCAAGSLQFSHFSSLKTNSSEQSNPMLILQMLLSTMASNQIQPKRRYSWLTATLLLALWSVNVPNPPCWASCRVVSTRPGQESTPGRTMKPCTNNLLLILLLSGANLLRNFTGSRRYSNQSSVLVQINRQNQGLSNSVGNIQTGNCVVVNHNAYVSSSLRCASVSQQHRPAA